MFGFLRGNTAPLAAVAGNGQPSSANVLSGVTGAFVGRCGRAVYARFIGPQPTLLDMSSPSARPLKYPHRGEPFDHQAHIDHCRLIIVPSGSKPASAPRNALSGGISRQGKQLLHFRQSDNTGQLWAFCGVWVLITHALSDLVDPADGYTALFCDRLCQKS